MNRQRFAQFVCGGAALLLLQAAAAAQTGALRGRVLSRQTDGTTVPLGGATVDVFRVDLSGRYNTKTADDGEFVFAGLPYVGEYLITASAPKAKPRVIANVKAGRDVEYELVLEPGDGTRLTREEATAAFKEAPKAETANDILSRTFREGNQALFNGNYDEAIKLFNEGLAVRPGEPVLLVQKSAAFTKRGVERYNAAISTRDETEKSTKIGLAYRDFREAAEAVTMAVEIIKAEIIPTAETDRRFQHNIKMVALGQRAEAMRLLVTKVDPAQAAVGLAAFQEYIDEEDDPARKSKAELDAARMLLEAKNTKGAIDQYRRILVSDPQNLEAIFGYGFALYRSGERDRFQEAARYLQYFLDLTSGADPLRQMAAEALEKLKALK